MKSASRTKVGNRSGNPGYRTQATFRGNRSLTVTSQKARLVVDKKHAKQYGGGSN